MLVYRLLKLVPTLLASGEIISAPTTDGSVVADLDQYPEELLGWDNAGGASNAGDEADNDFTIEWRCGTAEGGMNGVSLLEQTVGLIRIDT